MQLCKTEENLTIFDYGCDGFKWEKQVEDIFGRTIKSQYISGDDLLEYSLNDLIPDNFPILFTENEQNFFISEFFRIKANTKHRDFYDANENEWRDYDD